MDKKIYIFDMDHTLINADCDVTWKYYAVKHGLAPATALREADEFFEQYKQGTLDAEKFMLFQFREFIGRSEAEMAAHAARHFSEYILANIYPAAEKLLAKIIGSGNPVAILTSTNNVLARPVADYLGISTALGTTLELRDGLFTGRISGEYGAREGKIAPAKDFAAKFGCGLDNVEYYGDSINDVNIMELVGFPVAANPSPDLAGLAAARNWRTVHFGE